MTVNHCATCHRSCTPAPLSSDAESFSAVFMGMGEPLLNLRAVTAAARYINSDLGIGARHITVSTVGVPNAVGMLAQSLKEHSLQITLAVSIHAPSQAVRQRIIPRQAQTHPVSPACWRQLPRRRWSFPLAPSAHAGMALGAERALSSTSAVWMISCEGWAGTRSLCIGVLGESKTERGVFCCSAKAYPLDALLQDCNEFLEVTGRRVTFEYTLLAGVNDSPAQVWQQRGLLFPRHASP